MPGIHAAKQVADSVFAALQTAIGASLVNLNRKVPFQNSGSAETGASEKQPPQVAVYVGPEEPLDSETFPYVDAKLRIYVDIYGLTQTDNAFAAWPTYRTLVEEALTPQNNPTLGSSFIVQVKAVGADAPILEDLGDTVVEVLRTHWDVHYRRVRGSPTT